MNRIFTLITLLILSIPGFSQWNEGSSALGYRMQTRFSVTSFDNQPIRVMINGRWIQDQNNEIRIGYLNPGMHRIQIYSFRRNGRDRDGRDRDNRGWGNNRNGELIYNVNLNIRAGMHTDIIINRFGRVFVDEQIIDFRGDDNGNNGGWYNNGGGWNNGNNGNGWLQPMDQNSFQQLKRTVQNESFDDNRLSILRSVLPNNGISTAQVRELIQLMSFEQNKLELAKFAYRYTTDRNNYFMVNDLFSFGNSKRELSNYILNYRD
jgi:hypothetical protein